MKSTTSDPYRSASDVPERSDSAPVGAVVHAGFPSPADDLPDMPLDLNRELVRNPASTFFVRVAGNALAGDGIGDGDLLVVDRSVEPYDGCIALCCMEGELVVRHVRLGRDGIRFSASAPHDAFRRMERDGDFSIWGVVRHAVKTFR